MVFKCLLVDDEPLAIKLIESHIAKLPSLEVVATCNNPLEAYEILQNKNIDLLFLDIKMPNISGVDFLRTIKNPPPTIFTTAYRDYALESYDLEVIDYLLKPITFQRFFKAVHRFMNPKVQQQEVVNVVSEFFLFKSGNKHHKIFFKDIVYVESLKDYVKIHFNKDKSVVGKYKISDIEQRLKDKDFLRIHRSFIVNKKRITAFSSTTLEIDFMDLPIGASYKSEVDLFIKSIKNQ